MTTAVLDIPQGASGGVSSTISKGTAWNLREAEFLDLLYVATSEAARSAVLTFLPIIEAAEHRKRARGPKGRAKVLETIGAVLGGILVPGLTKSRCVHRAMSKGSFVGRIGYLQAKPVLDCLAGEGFLVRYPGIQFLRSMDGGGEAPSGMTTRYEATAALYSVAEAHGITEETVAAAFTRKYPSEPAKVVELLTLKTIEVRNGRRAVRGGGGGVVIPISTKDITAAAMRKEIRDANSVLARCRWENCQPPQLYRVFREDWTFGGRWVVAGSVTVQSMNEATRLRITMDGSPVSECDATASHLTILAGLAGITQLPEDPYNLPGYPRRAVKQAVVAALGNGRLPIRWPIRTLEDYPMLTEVDIKPLAAALAASYPFLRDPGGVLEVERRRVALRLQAIEAEILTRAMVPLWRDCIPVVPLHDAILCPTAHAERVKEAMTAAYRAGGRGAEVRVTVDCAT